MADNFLEKQYADYQARKSAMQSGAQRKSRQAMWQVSEIIMSSTDDEAMRQFYIELFGGEYHERGVQFDNGLIMRFESQVDTKQNITIRMASRYQYEQLLHRLTQRGIPHDNGTILDPSGNKIVIVV
ncbi:MAG: hypothetical protein IKY67_01630 [Paludibacteraceae bacterium]|nr:hypothetical protein [Paludibacteraceae bacterium]